MALNLCSIKPHAPDSVALGCWCASVLHVDVTAGAIEAKKCLNTGHAVRPDITLSCLSVLDICSNGSCSTRCTTMQISCQRVVGSQVETRTRMQPCESMYRPSATSFCTSASSVCSCAKSGRSSGAMLRHAFSVRVYVSGAAGGKLGKLGCVTKSPQDTCCMLGRWPGAICLHAQKASFRTTSFSCLPRERGAILAQLL